MSQDAVVAVSARNRRALADLVESLDADQLAAPSLCAGWDVRTVAGHVASVLTMSLPGLLLAMVRARGDVDRAIDQVARRVAERPVPEIVATLRDRADSRFSPPGTGPHGPMTDSLVHTADIAVPLGIPYDPDPADVRLGLDHVVGRAPTGFTTRRRLAGLRFVADDAGFAHGEGAEIRGRGIDLLVAACGRPAVLDRLAGPGVEVLRERIG
ncbi:maleylpyruvate isomerase family mycothiol-dependent enzyme [Pseudonocardia sp. NPDC046786]|uniref:maleylpyruvate isomerase family mycothiol-dependent enzyme n=1 Tax=Pseudonocardia sp. NPDC046786 TaxID=3155471 RepID=UPI0033D69A50